MSQSDPEPAKSGRSAAVFVLWAVVMILLGGVLTSYHVPFLTPVLTPGEKILNIGGAASGWQAVHLLSGGCGCSQRVLAHLVKRGRIDGVAERIVMVDGLEIYLPGTAQLLAKLDRGGTSIRHVSAESAARDFGVRGVPLLLIAAPDGKIAYLGGYGSAGDQDSALLSTLRAGNRARPLAAVGCAIGAGLRARADPLSLKYETEKLWQTLQRAWSAPSPRLEHFPCRWVSRKGLAVAFSLEKTPIAVVGPGYTHRENALAP